MTLVTAGQRITASLLNQGQLQSYTPVWTAPTANPAIGNGTLRGQYSLVGQQCYFAITMVAGSTTTFGTGAWVFSLPLTANAADSTVWHLQTFRCFDSSAGQFWNGVGGTNTGGSTTTVIQLAPDGQPQAFASILDVTHPFAWATSDTLQLSGTYLTV